MLSVVRCSDSRSMLNAKREDCTFPHCSPPPACCVESIQSGSGHDYISLSLSQSFGFLKSQVSRTISFQLLLALLASFLPMLGKHFELENVLTEHSQDLDCLNTKGLGFEI